MDGDGTGGRYRPMAKECAERACESFAAWCANGFSVGFFLVVRLRGPLRLPSSQLLSACLSSTQEDPGEAEDRIAFFEALLSEVMSLQTSLAERRARLTRYGMAAAYLAGIALLAFVAALALAGLEFSAASALLGAAAVWMSGGIRAERREAALYAATDEVGEICRFVPWEDNFAETMRKLHGTVPDDIHLGF